MSYQAWLPAGWTGQIAMAKPKGLNARAIEASGERIALRPFRQDDIAIVGVWLSEAAQRDPEDTWLAITLDSKEEPIGIITYRAGYPKAGWLTIRFVGVAPPLRVCGYGSEAVRLLETEARRLGLASSFRADVDPNSGLSLYFWLRLGYRPVAAEDIIAMIRESREET